MLVADQGMHNEILLRMDLLRQPRRGTALHIKLSTLLSLRCHLFPSLLFVPTEIRNFPARLCNPAVARRYTVGLQSIILYAAEL